jgi:glucosyl-dolichyl phosphate glucuronosyltransferase
LNSLTVIVCAYADDRWETLCLGIGMARKQMSTDDELIVVVDHNEPLLEQCRAAFDDCVVLANTQRHGLSGARNTALQRARGAVIVFLDDDAVPLDGWLDALRAPYADERVFGVGGLTRPRWPAGQPRWFPAEFLWVVGCSHLGLPTVQSPVRNLTGANMSFRRAVFERVGGFAEALGRNGKRPLGCEETELCIRLTQANPAALLLFDPSAEVEHHMTEERKTFGYFVRRCWAEGLSKAEVSRRVGRSDALSSERDYTRRVLPQGIWRGLRQALRGDLSGIARSSAIATGLAVTTAGYGSGALLSHASRSDRQ